MSGWHLDDRSRMSKSINTSGNASNKITQPGHLMNNSNGSGMKSRTIAQAHFKALRCYRHWCRMVPWILKVYSMRENFNEAEAKKHLARHWRHANKVRDPQVVDEIVMRWYEKMGNIKQVDVWGGLVLDIFAPQGNEQYNKNEGYSFADEVKYGDKSEFIKDFYKGGRNTLY